MASKQSSLIILKHKGLHGGIIFLGLLVAGCWLLNRNSVMLFLELNFTSDIADLAARILKLLGMNVLSTGISVTGHGFSIDIKYGCNAIYEIAVFVAAVAAYPLRVKDKIAGIIIGSVTIYTLNLLRVIVLFLSGVYFPGVFKTVHENIAQNIFIFILVILWLLWITRSAGRGHQH